MLVALRVLLSEMWRMPDCRGTLKTPDSDALTAPSLPRPAVQVSDGDAEARGRQGASKCQAHRVVRAALQWPAELHSPASSTPKPWAWGSEWMVLLHSGPAWQGCRDRHQGTPLLTRSGAEGSPCWCPVQRQSCSPGLQARPPCSSQPPR